MPVETALINERAKATWEELEPEEVISTRKNDPTHPNHYARFAIEPIDFISKNKLDWLVGNVVKYVCRYDAKNGLEDLKKARVNLDTLIKRVEESDG